MQNTWRDIMWLHNNNVYFRHSALAPVIRHSTILTGAKALSDGDTLIQKVNFDLSNRL